MTAPDDRAPNVEPSSEHPRQGGPPPENPPPHETESRLDHHDDLLTPEDVRRDHEEQPAD